MRSSKKSSVGSEQVQNSHRPVGEAQTLLWIDIAQQVNPSDVRDSLHGLPGVMKDKE